MTRVELAKKVYAAHGGMTFAAAQQVVSQVLDLMTDGLTQEGRLVISGFGTFRVVRRKSRTGRDMGKGLPVQIPERKTVVFIPSRKWTTEVGDEQQPETPAEP